MLNAFQMILIYRNVFFPIELTVLRQIRKVLKVEKLSKTAEDRNISKKIFILLKGIFSKIEGEKHVGAGRLFCFHVHIAIRKPFESFKKMKIDNVRFKYIISYLIYIGSSTSP